MGAHQFVPSSEPGCQRWPVRPPAASITAESTANGAHGSRAALEKSDQIGCLMVVDRRGQGLRSMLPAAERSCESRPKLLLQTSINPNLIAAAKLIKQI